MVTEWGTHLTLKLVQSETETHTLQIHYPDYETKPWNKKVTIEAKTHLEILKVILSRLELGVDDLGLLLKTLKLFLLGLLVFLLLGESFLIVQALLP